MKKIVILGLLILILGGCTILAQKPLQSPLNASGETLGATVLAVYQGGTGRATFASGECLVGNGTGGINTQACGTGGGGIADFYKIMSETAITPTTSVGLLISASSTIDILTSTMLNATTTNIDNLVIFTGSTFPANDITDAEVSNTLTCSDLVAGSAVVDISTETNLTAGDALTLTDDDIDFYGGVSPGGTLGGTWASPTVDSDGTWTVHDSYPAACAAGEYVSAIGDTNTCSVPAGGSGGIPDFYKIMSNTAITPSTTVGLLISASSTIDILTAGTLNSTSTNIGTLTVYGNATTVGAFSAPFETTFGDLANGRYVKVESLDLGAIGIIPMFSFFNNSGAISNYIGGVNGGLFISANLYDGGMYPPEITFSANTDAEIIAGKFASMGYSTTTDEIEYQDAQHYKFDASVHATGTSLFNAIHIFDDFTTDDTGLVTNLNADLLDSQHGSYYLNWDNLTNKAATSTILSLLDSDYRIAQLNATTTNADNLFVFNSATTTNYFSVGSNLGVGLLDTATSTFEVLGNSNFWGNVTTTGNLVVGDDDNSGTTTLSIQTDGTSGSCWEYKDCEGTLYHFYYNGTTQVIETGACNVGP
jgi:hypothetical protein